MMRPTKFKNCASWQVMAENSTLTTKQRRAIGGLLTARTVQEAALVAGVGERTLYRWLEDAAFRQELRQAEGNMIHDAGRRLLSGQDQALDALEDLITRASKDADRRLAAATWLDYCLRYRELGAFEERLAALEEAIYGDKRNTA